MSGVSVNGASGGGGFPKIRESGGTLADGTVVSEVFDEITELLEKLGYHKEWVDGWKRNTDGAIVTHGYTYREVRVRRYLPGHKEGPPQAVLSIKDGFDLDDLDRFIGSPSETWT